MALMNMARPTMAGTKLVPKPAAGRPAPLRRFLRKCGRAAKSVDCAEHAGSWNEQYQGEQGSDGELTKLPKGALWLGKRGIGGRAHLSAFKIVAQGCRPPISRMRAKARRT